ncbi:acetyl-CoA carboxylase carboxyl transferase subunit alpha [methane-oxidizing endosymbiont of Gigantopelta aegis]|uniref:acetyl-CoA carboxylase carboxyl transferase subunit alpha n=1 Tax=methane-oxidizing endosymbiont of Gigantopelta aegis TaxID=2794938 RepID=UPI0018DDB8ED|nr:acetyl-CoA carboxylase carboxyl transferase subunit alpha [methane-oxidizing endosymbiont of Gigantopelta aegis]
MDLKFLDFEQPIAELEAKIEELRKVEIDNEINISDTLQELEKKCEMLTESIFQNLTDWQISQLSRHPGRPYTLDYIDLIFTDFHELHGDRAFADDPAIVCGLARLEGQPVMVIGHQKGRDTKEKIYRNFGMPRPEGYRKALRMMKMAERFKLPLICLIDTPGAYPGIGAEERGQSEAIARNLFEMARLKTPIICVVIGEGGSGGALAIGVGDRLIMLEYSTYAVISPEGCASILWKSADKAQLAAEAMAITSDRIREQGFLDEVVREPLGGGHRDFQKTAMNLRETLLRHLDELKQQAEDMEQLLETRYQRIMRLGSYIDESVK